MAEPFTYKSRLGDAFLTGKSRQSGGIFGSFGIPNPDPGGFRKRDSDIKVALLQTLGLLGKRTARVVGGPGTLGGEVGPLRRETRFKKGSGLKLDKIFGSGGLDFSGISGYGGIVEQRQDVLRQLLGQYDQLGESERGRIATQFDSARGAELARLEARGLGASNLGAAAVGAVEDARSQALLDLADRLLAGRIGLQERQYEGIFGTQERGLEAQQRQQEAALRFTGQLLSSIV